MTGLSGQLVTAAVEGESVRGQGHVPNQPLVQEGQSVWVTRLSQRSAACNHVLVRCQTIDKDLQRSTQFMRDPIHQIALCSCFCGVKIPLCARFTTGCDVSEVNDESGGRVVDCEEKVFGDLLWWSCTVGCQNGLLSSFGGTYFTVCGPHTDYKWSHYELHAGKLPHCSRRPTQSLESKITHCI